MTSDASDTRHPDIAFATSEPLTIGIEEEFLLVESGDLATVAPRAGELLDSDWRTIASPGGWLKAELLRCSIELATAPNASLAQVDVDLRALRDAIAERAAAANVAAIGIGLHPDLRVDDDLVTPTDAHRAIADLHTRVGTLADQSTHGIHVHVGMPSLDDAVRVTDALAACAPVFVALSANSPIDQARRAPWRTARSEIQRRMLWAGPTPRCANPADYRAVHALHQLENPGDQRFLWEVAPVPALGTVEVRSFDSTHDPRVPIAMAALVQGIAALVLDGGEITRPAESIERHNRWSAMEFGTRARFLVAGHDAPVDVADVIRELVDRVRPHAEELGSAPALDVIDDLLATPRADALIEAFESGGVPALLDYCRIRPGALDHGDT